MGESTLREKEGSKEEVRRKRLEVKEGA